MRLNRWAYGPSFSLESVHINRKTAFSFYEPSLEISNGGEAITTSYNFGKADRRFVKHNFKRVQVVVDVLQL